MADKKKFTPNPRYSAEQPKGWLPPYRLGAGPVGATRPVVFTSPDGKQKVTLLLVTRSTSSISAGTYFRWEPEPPRRQPRPGRSTSIAEIWRDLLSRRR